jgi:hypothetical protein
MATALAFPHLSDPGRWRGDGGSGRGHRRNLAEDVPHQTSRPVDGSLPPWQRSPHDLSPPDDQPIPCAPLLHGG